VTISIVWNSRAASVTSFPRCGQILTGILAVSAIQAIRTVIE
jgi:hypothetical protein